MAHTTTATEGNVNATTNKISLRNLGPEWRTQDDAYNIQAHRSHTTMGKACHYTIGRNRGLEWNSYEAITDNDGRQLQFAKLADARAYLANLLAA